MAEQSTKGVGSGTGNAVADRTKKAAITRSLTAAKVAQLPAEMKYAYKQVTACRNSLDSLADVIVNGGSASGELLAAIAAVQQRVGECMFAT